MSDTAAPAIRRTFLSAHGVLKASGVFWFLVAAAGQWAFVYYIVAAYVPPTAAGDFAAWDEVGLIDGYIAGDLLGNLGFISHVLLAAVITVGGTMQLVPPLRRNFPAVHRWTGRTFLILAVFMAVGGIALIWGRGTRLNDVTAIGTTINGVLILIVSAFVVRHAIARRIDTHRRWAMRLFVLVSGVWFLRVFYMAWGISTGGAGIGAQMSGPTDYAFAFACYLLPLAVLEIYLRACDSRSGRAKLTMAAVLTAATLLMGVGIAGAYLVMWSPHF